MMLIIFYIINFKLLNILDCNMVDTHTFQGNGFPDILQNLHVFSMYI